MLVATSYSSSSSSRFLSAMSGAWGLSILRVWTVAELRLAFYFHGVSLLRLFHTKITCVVVETVDQLPAGHMGWGA